MQLKTKKQKLYFDEVIRLHYEHGYGEDRISRILPIGHSTVSRWIGIFAAEKNEKPVTMRRLKSPKEVPPSTTEVNDIQSLQLEVARLQEALRAMQLRADAYEEMIHLAESKFNIAIRKKAGAKR